VIILTGGLNPDDPVPNEPTVEGIGTGLVPNCLGEMFPIGMITYLGLPCLGTQMLQIHNHRMDVVIGG
jgi:hypothetical protein